MAHIGLFCPPVPGHLNAMGTLGRTLAKRGHRVTAFQIPDAKSAIEAQRLEFQPLGEGQADTRALADAVARLGELTGFRAMRFSIRCGAALAKAICEYGPAAIDKAGAEFLVIDQNEPAGATVAQHLGLPFVNIMAGLPLNREPQMPPPFVPWAHTGRFTTTLLNAAAYRAFDTLVAPVNRVLNRYRRVWGLPPVSRPDDTFSQLAQLSQLTEDLDFPRVAKPAALLHLGPFKDNERASVLFPYERLNGKPLVYASLGTLQNRREGAFQVIAEACAGLDVQLVIAAGGGSELDPSQCAGNPILVKFAPQLDLLKRAAICITHGGMNTVMESLSFGVPMVVIPMTNDNPAIAARVKRAGGGEIVPSHRLRGSRLREAVRRVLFEPHYRRRAEDLRTSIDRAGGVARAADIVEATVGPSSTV